MAVVNAGFFSGLLLALGAGVTAQVPVQLQPGDLLRFVVVETIGLQDLRGVATRSVVQRTERTGTFVSMVADTATVRIDGAERGFEISALEDVRVRREFPDRAGPMRRAAVGSLVGAAVGVIATLCYPVVFGGGCEAADSEDYFIGAGVGAATFGLLRAVFGPRRQEWVGISLEIVGTGVGPDAVRLQASFPLGG